MRALITGCAGFAGSHLAEYVLAQGFEVVGLVRLEQTLSNLRKVLPQLRLERADILDARRVLQVLRDTKPQRIYHLAAFSSPRKSLQDARLTYETNFFGTFNVLSAWLELELDSRLLCVSSADVYGPVQQNDLPLREEAELRPSNPYAVSKAAADLLAMQYYRHHGLPIVCARPFHHTGPRQRASFVCSGFARQIVEAELGLRPDTVTVGNLGVRRDFTDVRDIVRGYYLLLENGQLGEIYHLCSGRAVSLETILHTLCSLASKPIQVAVEPSLLRNPDVPILVGDPAKARHAVSWVPQYPLETTLQDLKLYWEEVIRSGN